MIFMTVFVIGPILTTVSIHDYFSDKITWGYLIKNLVMKTQYSLPGVFEANPGGSGVNGSLWTLPYEIACYIVLLAIFLLLKDRGKHIWNLVIGFIILEGFLSTRLFMPGQTNSEVYLLPASFAFGAFLAVNKETIRVDAYFVGGLLLLLIIFRDTSFAPLLFVYTIAIGMLLLSTTNTAMKISAEI